MVVHPLLACLDFLEHFPKTATLRRRVIIIFRLLMTRSWRTARRCIEKLFCRWRFLNADEGRHASTCLDSNTPTSCSLSHDLISSLCLEDGLGLVENGHINNTPHLEPSMEDAAIPEPSCSIRPPTPILRDAEEGRLAYDKGPFHASEKPASAAGSRQAVKLHPIHQLEVARYARGYNVRDGKNVFNGLIPAFREEYVHEQLEIGWRRVMHVEGTVYFVHEERGMCTEADVSNPAVLSQIYDAIDLVDDLYAEAGKARSRYHEVVFERWEDEDSDSEVAWGYYIADHEHRILFWAQEQSAYVLMREQIFVSDVQIGHALKSAYWDHITLYPRPLPWECINDVYSFATLCIGDAVFAPGETLCPYSLEHLESILNIMDRSHHVPSLRDNLGFVVVVAQALSMREHTRFLHYHGEPGARLTFGQSVYGAPFRKRHTIVFWTLSVFLWGKPLQSLHQLERAFVDEVLTLPYWSNFISTEVTRWTNIATQCMILGAANIAFLAIPTVIPSEDTDRLDHWTWAQLLSFWSSATLLIAITTTVIGRNYYSSLDGSDSDAAPVIDFLHSQKIRRGLLMKEFESLAVWHSLPLGCLLWGTLLATASFASWSFDATRSSTLELALLWSFSGCLLVIMGSIWLGVFVGWDLEAILAVIRRDGE